MAKKKKLQSTAPVLTRGQLSRAAKEKQQIRNLYTAGIGIGLLVVLVLGFALAFTYIIRPNQEVAKVNDTSINRATYNNLRRWNVYQQLEQDALTSQLSGSTDTTGATTTSAAVTSDLAALKGVDNETQLDATTVQTLVDDEVLRQASIKDYSLSPSQDELMAEAVTDFIPQPTAPPSSETPSPAVSETATSDATATSSPTGTQTPSATSTPTITSTPGSPTSTPTDTATYPPVPGATQTAQAGFSSFLDSIKLGPASVGPYCPYGCPNLSQSDYLSVVIEPRLRQKQVTDKLATGIITDVEQVRIQEIITDTQAAADSMLTSLDGGADFNALAVGQTSSAATTGGIVDWFAKDDSGLDQVVVDTAFSTAEGKYSKVVTSTTGQFYIIKVLEHADKRPLSSTQLDTKKTKLYTDWFTKAKSASTISPTTFQAPTPTAPPLVEPTSPPSNTTPTAAGSPAAGTSPTAAGTATTASGGTGTGTSTVSPAASSTPAPAASATP